MKKYCLLLTFTLFVFIDSKAQTSTKSLYDTFENYKEKTITHGEATFLLEKAGAIKYVVINGKVIEKAF